MKKLLSILIALILIGGVAMAENIDYASMTDEELRTVIDTARIELAKREQADNPVLFESFGITCYMTGEMRLTDSGFLYVEVVCVNESDVAISFTNNESTVNGWQSFVNGIGTVSAGAKAKGEIQFNVKSAGITSLDELEDFTVSFDVLDKTNVKGLGKTELARITLK